MAAHSQWDLAHLVDQVKAVCEITPDGCWLWRYGTWAEHKYVDEQHRYPKIMIKTMRKLVIHWILEVTGRPRPSRAMEACHSCHRPPCCNPDHLRWDTHKGNMAEMGENGRAGPTRHPESRGWGPNHKFRLHPELAKRGPVPGDYASGDDHYTRRNPDLITWQGTAHYRARLDPDKVREIRWRADQGEGPVAIARRFGVGTSTVQAVLEGRTWKSVK